MPETLVMSHECQDGPHAVVGPQGNRDGELAAPPNEPAQTGDWLERPSLVVPAGLRQLALALLSQTGPRAGSGRLQIHRRGFEVH